MSTAWGFRSVAGIAIATCLALPLSGGSAAGATKPSSPKSGLFVAGESRITANTEPAAYAADVNGYEHFVQFRTGASAAKGKIAFYSRKIGAKSWTVHDAPGTFDLSGHPRLELVPQGFNQGAFFIVAYTCSGVYAVEQLQPSSRLDEFTEVSPVADCASSAPLRSATSYFDQIDGIAGLSILVPDATTSGQWDVITGNTRGPAFHERTTVPTADHFVPTVFATREAGPRMVIGRGVDAAGHEGVYATELGFHLDRKADQWQVTWTTPTEIASLHSASKDYTISSAAVRGRRVDVGLYLPVGSRSGQKHTLFVDERDDSGQWSSPQPLPGAGLHDRDLILSVNTSTGKLRAAWLRSVTSSAKAKKTKSGIMTSRKLAKGWTTSTFATHWYKDRPISTSYDGKTHPHFFYQRTR